MPAKKKAQPVKKKAALAPAKKAVVVVAKKKEPVKLAPASAPVKAVAPLKVAAAAPPVRQESYAGQSFLTAAESYLRAQGQPATAEEIVAALAGGGFLFELHWPAEERASKAFASLVRNQKVFRQLPEGRFGLVE